MAVDDTNKLVNFTKKVVIIISQGAESVMSTKSIIILKQLPLSRTRGNIMVYNSK